MKTLHLVNAWQPNGGGGITTFYRALLKHAASRGESMVLVRPGEHDGVEEFGSTRIHAVKAPRSVLNGSYRMIMPWAWPGVNERVQQILRDERPDLVDICDKYSLHYVAGLVRRGWLKGVGRPVLVGTSCERMDENMAHYVSGSKLASSFCRLYLKWNYFGFFDHHITVSPHTAGELREAARGHVRRRGVWIMRMGVDCGRFQPALATPEARRRWLLRLNAAEGARILVYAGRLVPEKNLPLLFDSFATLLRRGQHDYRLAVAGAGMLRAPLEAECATRFGDAVTFLGNLGSAELAELLANGDAFLHPNPREPFGIAPLEAMASGLPLVACRGGGVLCFAHDGNAWLAEPDAASFAGKVDELFAGEWNEKREAALETARRHDWPMVAQSFRDLYRDLVSGEARGAAFESTEGNWLGVELTGEREGTC